MKHYSLKEGTTTERPPAPDTYRDLMPFGKYMGQDIVDVPSSYLRWLCLTDDIDKRYPKLIKAADEELKFRDKRGCHFEEDGGRRG